MTEIQIMFGSIRRYHAYRSSLSSGRALPPSMSSEHLVDDEEVIDIISDTESEQGVEDAQPKVAYGVQR